MRKNEPFSENTEYESNSTPEVDAINMNTIFNRRFKQIVEIADPRRPDIDNDLYLDAMRKWLLVKLRSESRDDPHWRTIVLIRAKLAVIGVVRRSIKQRAIQPVSSAAISAAPLISKMKK